MMACASLRESDHRCQYNTASGAAAGECPQAPQRTRLICKLAPTHSFSWGGTDTPRSMTWIFSANYPLWVQHRALPLWMPMASIGHRNQRDGQSDHHNLWILGGQDNGWAGGGISSGGQLTLTNSVLIANTSTASVEVCTMVTERQPH